MAELRRWMRRDWSIERLVVTYGQADGSAVAEKIPKASANHQRDQPTAGGRQHARAVAEWARGYCVQGFRA